MKKLIALTLSLMLALAACAAVAESGDATILPEAGKTLVVYYSATGNTERIAGIIAAETGADVFTLEPVNPYSAADLNWTDTGSRVSYEHNHPEARQEVALMQVTPENWKTYDTVYIGYPIWWGIAAWPVNQFVTGNDFTGKTVIPFCTSASSDLGESDTLLADMAGTGTWLAGHRFSSRAEEEEVLAWVREMQQAEENAANILVVYFSVAENSAVDVMSSASITPWRGETVGTISVLATMIQERVGGEMYSIDTSVAYPAETLIDYAADELEQQARPELINHIETFDQYDTFFIGYPTWWYDMPMVMYSFFDEYDFAGKTIIPFNTHNGSRFSGTIQTIQQLEPEASVVEDGFTINERSVASAENELDAWLERLGYGK